MGAVVRHYAAVKDGRVVGSCSTIRQYRWAVLHHTKVGTFATFHTTLDGAERATLHMASSAPDKELIAPIETKTRVQAGAPFDVTEAHDDEGDPDDEDIALEHILRELDILESCWRES